MSIAFSGGELIDIAIGIEKQGIVFYDVMARSTKQLIARDLFIHLAEAERVHAETFRGMLDTIEKYTPLEDQLREYGDYLQALVNNAVFTDEMATSELATHIDSEIEAVDIGISAEKDSILFYYYMKEILPPAGRTILEKILNEEKSHLSQLNELKKKMLNMKQPG
jgi:rubrerythrin